MDHDQWTQSPVGDAVSTFQVFGISIGITLLGNSFGGIVSSLFNKAASQVVEKAIQDNPGLSDYAIGKLRTVFDSNRDEAIRNGMALVILWSAFESCFKDFCRGVIVQDPSVLQDMTGKKPNIPITELFADDSDKATIALRAIENAVGKKAGVDGLEDVLGYLDLSDSTSKVFKDPIYEAQIIRHIWAHRFGIADAKFVADAKHLGYSPGELVTVTTNKVGVYLNALVIYMTIVANRHRAKFGLPPLPLSSTNKTGDTAKLYEEYVRLYPNADSAPDTSPSASDAPPESPVPPSAEESQVQTSSPDSAQDPTQ